MSTLTALSALLVRRRRPLMVAPPPAFVRPFEVDYELDFASAEEAPTADRPRGRWAEDARFFATCYLVGLVFFLVMLS